jgi:hypothetical protein
MCTTKDFSRALGLRCRKAGHIDHLYVDSVHLTHSVSTRICGMYTYVSSLLSIHMFSYSNARTENATKRILIVSK